MFGLLKTEATHVSECPYVVIFVVGSVSLATILDQDQIVLLGDFYNLVDFTGVTKKMYQDDGASSIGNASFYGVWYHVQW